MAHMEKKQVSCLSYVLIEDEEKIADAISKLKGHENIAVDCEGVDLSRTGTLTVISVACKEEAFIFDIKKLGTKPFQQGLQEILESNTPNKLMFDCRNDSDALWHQFQVKLNRVLDIQLMEILYRENKGEFDINDVEKRLVQAINRRRGGGVEKEKPIYLHGLKKVIGEHLENEEYSSAKSSGMPDSCLFEQVWDERPLTETLLRYASADVLSLFPLFEKFKSELSKNSMSRLQTASAVYAALKRDKANRSDVDDDDDYDEYEQNAYLPMCVIPQHGSHFAEGSIQCIGCRRKFPFSFFTATQRRKGTPYCPLCKRIKFNIDKEINREKMFEEQEQAEIDSYVDWKPDWMLYENDEF